ncbi:MAG: SH3 domain-containing protein [Clostridia bacterium]|nr:SH3 domain-containing protein [Clostridia bacterium]
MNRKLIAIFAALLLATSLCACQDDKPDDETDTSNTINIGTSQGEDGSESENGTDNETESSSEVVTEPPVELTFTEQKDTVYVISSTNQVNLRSEPIVTDSTARLVVENGAELQRIAVSTDGSWSKVVYDGGEYYIKSTYVTTLKDLDEGFTEVSKTLYLTVESLYVRIAPDMSNEAIDTIYKGNKVEVIAENTETGWYKIKFAGAYATEGYVAISSGATQYFSETAPAAE